MDDISSFARTLTKLERLMAKLDMAVSNTRCMFGVKNMELTYDVSLRVAELMEKAEKNMDQPTIFVLSCSLKCSGFSTTKPPAGSKIVC